MKELGTIANSRTPAQFAHMQRTVGSGICPFCEIDYCVNIMLAMTEFWRFWRNPFPYSGHAYHYILASIPHWTRLNQIPRKAMVEWFELNIWAIKRFNLPGGGLVMRFGGAKWNASTVSHCHSHIQVPIPGKLAIAVFSKPPFALISAEPSEKLKALAILAGKKPGRSNPKK